MTFYRTTTGHEFSTSEWLDLHFDAVIPEYELMLRQVGIKSGWNVLDAGCGNGRFIDMIDKLVGPKGQVCGLDLAPENIKLIEKKIEARRFSCKVTASVGDILSLPFGDNIFDAVWCAAVTQYLTEEQLEKVLHEFKRVVKPGGVIAVKEYDGISAFYYPTPGLTLLWKSIDRMDHFDQQRLLVHPLGMQRFLEHAGLKDVTQKTILIERRHPLRQVDKLYIEGLIQTGQVSWAPLESLSKEDQEKWHALLSEASSEYILKQPDFYWREGHIVATGRSAQQFPL